MPQVVENHFLALLGRYHLSFARESRILFCDHPRGRTEVTEA